MGLLTNLVDEVKHSITGQHIALGQEDVRFEIGITNSDGIGVFVDGQRLTRESVGSCSTCG